MAPEIYFDANETFLYVHGVEVDSEVRLSEYTALQPVKSSLPIEIAAEILEDGIDIAIAMLCIPLIASQLHITGKTPRDVGKNAWNSLWDLVLLSAVLNCETASYLQCSHSIETITCSSHLHVIDFSTHGLTDAPYTITDMDIAWINSYFLNAQRLLEFDLFMTAVHSMHSYRWHTMPRIKLAVLWAGIESLFRINSELSFRLGMYVAKFLGEGNSEQEKTLFAEVKDLYKARSSAVHGDKIKGDLDILVKKSACLLNRLIRKCAEENALPDIDELLFQ